MGSQYWSGALLSLFLFSPFSQPLIRPPTLPPLSVFLSLWANPPLSQPPTQSANLPLSTTHSLLLPLALSLALSAIYWFSQSPTVSLSPSLSISHPLIHPQPPFLPLSLSHPLIHPQWFISVFLFVFHLQFNSCCLSHACSPALSTQQYHSSFHSLILTLPH